MNKPLRKSASIVIENSEGEPLIVKRAGDDESFPGVWSLPATTRREGESPEDTAKRCAKDKLGIDIEVVKKIGEDTKDRGGYISHQVEFETRILKGEPVLRMSDPNVSQYTEVKYCDDISILAQAAREGSLCSQIYLRGKGIQWN